MVLDPRDRSLLNRYFDAMRAGPDGVDDLLALFTDDAVYIEPFSGQPRTHRGRAAIEQMLRASQENAPPDLTLTVRTLDVDADGVYARWTCESPAFPVPIEGLDRYVLRDSQIARLEVVFV